MARKARPQYECTGNFSANGFLLQGQLFSLINECTGNGEKATKKLSTHVTLKALDQKFFKERDLMAFEKQRVSKDNLSRFFTLVE